ncbi:MAG: hypothetical protein ACRCXM_08085 [Beijerinckiaceae bacterium]
MNGGLIQNKDAIFARHEIHAPCKSLGQPNACTRYAHRKFMRCIIFANIIRFESRHDDFIMAGFMQTQNVRVLKHRALLDSACAITQRMRQNGTFSIHYRHGRENHHAAFRAACSAR